MLNNPAVNLANNMLYSLSEDIQTDVCHRLPKGRPEEGTEDRLLKLFVRHITARDLLINALDDVARHYRFEWKAEEVNHKITGKGSDNQSAELAKLNKVIVARNAESRELREQLRTYRQQFKSAFNALRDLNGAHPEVPYAQIMHLFDPDYQEESVFHPSSSSDDEN